MDARPRSASHNPQRCPACAPRLCPPPAAPALPARRTGTEHAAPLSRIVLTHQPRQIRRCIQRAGEGGLEAPHSARRHHSVRDRVLSPGRGRPRTQPPNGGSAAEGGAQPEPEPELDGGARARARFRSAVRVVQATHRWQRQTKAAQSGQPWAKIVRLRALTNLCARPPATVSDAARCPRSRT